MLVLSSRQSIQAAGQFSTRPRSILFSAAHPRHPVAPRYNSNATAAKKDDPPQERSDEKREVGAMSRRLESMTEETLESDPRRAGKMVQEAGFSDELRRKLEDRIAQSKIGDEQFARAASIVDAPASAGQGTRDVAASQPWRGEEKMEDTALRMLEDAYKPLRGAAAAPRRQVAVKLPSLDMRMKHAARRGSPAERLANARDKTSIYALSQDQSMSEKDKEETRKMLKERFQPGARPMPASIQGLQSLASERIEDAIARGLFKNIPRGKGVNVERDYAASSPFLDTTEYFMNKIIQKQEVLPPWVEKQQEVTRTASSFRARLRNDWKRHAARVVASKGGSLAQQIRKAEQYAAAEAAVNPRPGKQEVVTSIDPQGQLTRVTVTEEPAKEQGEKPVVTITAEEAKAEAPTSETSSEAVSASTGRRGTPASDETSSSAPSPLEAPLRPFRDPAWEKSELTYHSLVLSQLNSLTRSYNLMAPELAKKPYFSLERELRACFADVAPLVAAEIRERASAPPDKQLGGFSEGHAVDGVMARFVAGERVRVWESRRPKYGFKEFWKDLWRGEGQI